MGFPNLVNFRRTRALGMGKIMSIFIYIGTLIFEMKNLRLTNSITLSRPFQHVIVFGIKYQIDLVVVYFGGLISTDDYQKTIQTIPVRSQSQFGSRILGCKSFKSGTVRQQCSTKDSNMATVDTLNTLNTLP